MDPDRVVIGADAGDEGAADAVAALYEPLGGEILRTDVASAEMIKLASNAFLATKISFINEIANVCEEVGADVGEVAKGMGLDERIGTAFLRAGIGYGGSCFPKDVSALKMLAGNTGYHFQLLTAVIEVNELQKRRVVGKLEKHLGSLIGKRVALLGLAFKPDTDDMREASSLVLAARLQGEGAEVVAYDPVAAERAAEPARLGRDGELGDGGARGRRRRRAGHRVARVRRARLGRRRRADGAAAARRRPQLPRPGEARRCRLRVRGDRRDRRTRPDGAAALAAPRPVRREGVQAIVLVGGEGTRLRPLTSDVPKPAVTLVDRPFLAYVIEWLAGHGVDRGRARLRLPPRRPARGARRRGGAGRGRDHLRRRAGAAGHRGGDPLRRRGARRPPRRPLPRPQRRRPLRPRPGALLRAHEERGRAGDDRPAPGRGLLRLRPRPLRRRGRRCSSSSRRPARAVPGEINAGAYVLERSVLDLVPAGRAVSIEREVFPRLVGDGLYGLLLDGYWMDIGTPERYLQASWDILEGRVETRVEPTAPGLLVAAGAVIDAERQARARGRRLRRLPARGGAGSSDSVLLEGCTVGEGALVRGSILAPGVEVAPARQLEDAVVGRDEESPALL